MPAEPPEEAPLLWIPLLQMPNYLPTRQLKFLRLTTTNRGLGPGRGRGTMDGQILTWKRPRPVKPFAFVCCAADRARLRLLGQLRRGAQHLARDQQAMAHFRRRAVRSVGRTVCRRVRFH